MPASLNKTAHKLRSPFPEFEPREWILWFLSLTIVILSNLLVGSVDPLTLVAVCLGVTSLMFAAVGNVWAQILMVFFATLYGIISWRFRYWGEMITYMGMTLPMAVWSTITWYRNPSKKQGQVEIRQMKAWYWAVLIALTALVTYLFYRILQYFNTPNLVLSTVSVTTSFMAASLTILRSSYFAAFYAMNDLVLIALWVLASMEDPGFIPVAVNFGIFFVNDVYGFVSWRKREKLYEELNTLQGGFENGEI